MDKDYDDFEDDANVPNENANISNSLKPLPKPNPIQNTLNQVSSVIKTVSPMITYFVPPETTEYMEWGQTILVILFLAAMFISIILMYIYSNLNEYQNRISVITNAYLFGQNPEQKFQTFIQNAQAESLATAMNNIQSTNQNLNTTNYRLNDKANRLANQVAVDVPNQYAQSNNLGISIQKNIGEIRDTISKLGGAFMLNNYMSNGAVKTVQSASTPQ